MTDPKDHQAPIDLDSLKKMLFSAALMSAIDGKFDQTEREVCLKFLVSNWLTEYGDVKVFFSTVLDEIKTLLKTGPKLYENIDRVATELALKLAQPHKDALMSLIENVMLSDGQAVVRETDLLNRYRKKIQNPHLVDLKKL
ncbi:MAG: hypothetical protein OEY59_00080 [Deltaproteobacteria bacterium]|nr:hypothetical protein [Deltaproteobacteria bacterium]